MINWYLANKWGLGRLYMCSHRSGASGESFRIFYAPRRSQTTPRLFGTVAGVTPLPEFEVLLTHNYFNDPGGSFEEGKAFQRLWFDIEHHNTTTNGTIKAYSGDADAYGQLYFPHPDVNYTAGEQMKWWIPVYLDWDGGQSTMSGFPILVVSPTRGLSGRGITLRIQIPNLGLGAVFKGWGGSYLPGPATRYGVWEVPV